MWRGQLVTGVRELVYGSLYFFVFERLKVGELVCVCALQVSLSRLCRAAPRACCRRRRCRRWRRARRRGCPTARCCCAAPPPAPPSGPSCFPSTSSSPKCRPCAALLLPALSPSRSLTGNRKESEDSSKVLFHPPHNSVCWFFVCSDVISTGWTAAMVRSLPAHAVVLATYSKLMQLLL
jgi:hypothetical protein